MPNSIDLWLESSDAPEGTKDKFTDLVSKIPKLPNNPKHAAIVVKEALSKGGFNYNQEYFLAQDVLNSRRGNCLGLPLLIGSILDEKLFAPRFGVVVNPQDYVYEMENIFLNSVNLKVNSDVTPLCTVQEEYPIYRFAPLEHLVVNTNGNF